jgi:hypothetical protein
MDYRTTLAQLTRTWLEGTPASEQAFHELLSSARQQQQPESQSLRDFRMGGGTLEHLVWGGFFQILSDSEAWNAETMEEIAAYTTQQRSYQGRAYIQSDFRPEMSESQRTVWEETSAFLRAVQDQEDLTDTDRDALEAQRDRLIAHWRALPLATRWEERSVCDEVLRQVFALLICQMSLAGSRGELWPHGLYGAMLSGAGTRRAPNLLQFVPWGRRALAALMGTDLVQLAWQYDQGCIAFSLI